jgi:deoxyribodipyrimidine photolyase-related protein
MTKKSPAPKITKSTQATRNLILVLGDQLNLDSPLLKNADWQQDAVLMIESAGEASWVWSHKARIALFLSAMRHFAATLREAGACVHYQSIESNTTATLGDALKEAIGQYQPAAVHCTEPGEWRVWEDITAACTEMHAPLHIAKDTHFLCDLEEFKSWAGAKKELRMEFFYRQMRKKHGVLMDKTGEPEGGQWNYDAANRSSYPKKGPGLIDPPEFFEPDAITTEVLTLVEERFKEHPGSLRHFLWPVTRAQALVALDRFIDARLLHFGQYEDAMWTDTPFGWHSLLSSSLNLKLIHPNEVIQRTEAAWRAGNASLEAAEGLIRQILGWREFIRGVYWLDMPKMGTANYFGYQRDLPTWYWTGKTKMACMADVIGQTLEYGYAHHIQRLMVMGNFSLLAGLSPQAVSDWFLAVYVDAVEWAELPNVAGMALFANGGRFTSKPYISSGAYIKRMSNYCSHCPYKPDVRAGEDACPFTTLYWNFLMNHQPEFEKNPRTRLMTANLKRIDDAEKKRIQEHAQILIHNIDSI